MAIQYFSAKRQFLLNDFIYIFIVFFALYNIGGQFNRIELDQFSHQVYLYSSLLTFSFLAMFLTLFTIFSKPIHGNFKYPVLLNQNYYGRMFLILGVSCTALGYIFLYINYSRLGNFAEIILNFSNRLDRNVQLQEMRGNIPFTHFLFVGLLTLYAGFLLRFQDIFRSVRFISIFLAPIMLFYIIDGERTAILKYLIGLTFVSCAFFFRRAIKVRKLFIIFLIVGFLFLSLIGNLRNYIGLSIVTRSVDPIVQFIDKKSEDDEVLNLFIPKEFPAVTYTTNRIIHNHTEQSYPYHYGKSYAYAIPYLFPRSIYDIFGGTKSQSIADDLGEEVRLEIGRLRKVSFGMAPLGESFANFGFFGPFFIATILFMWLRLLYRGYLSNYPLFALWACIQIPTLLFFHRSTFAWTTAVLIILTIFAVVLDWIIPKKSIVIKN